MEEIRKEIKEYVNLRVNSAKLSLVERLSRISGRGLSILIFILLMFMALLLFVVALTILLSEWVDSLVLAFVIMGGFMCLSGFVIYLLRNKIFTNSMVRGFSRLFFADSDDDDYDNDEE